MLSLINNYKQHLKHAHEIANFCYCRCVNRQYCFAQTTPPAIIEDFKPSTLNQPGQEYPQVNSQGYARFKILHHLQIA